MRLTSNVHRIGLLLGAALTAGACQPLHQPLGSIAPPVTGTAGTGAPGTPDTQIPSLPTTWDPGPMCNPAALRCYRDPASSPSSPASGQFSGTPDPDPAATPVIVYPLAGSRHPINLADITFQWRRGPAAAQTLFRIRLRRLSGDAFEFYVPCGVVVGPQGMSVDTECMFHPPPGDWIDVAKTAHGEALTLDIAGVDLTRPGIVATSEAMSISFSPESVRGGFYYWSTEKQGAVRLLFGAQDPQLFIVQKSSSNPFQCGGCHAISRDGSTMAFTAGDSDLGSLRVVATSDTSKPLFPMATGHDSGMSALNRDGSRVLVSLDGKLTLRDAATGAPLGDVSSALLGGRGGYHPEWSPDGKQIALTLSSDGTTDVAVRTGTIAVLPYNDGAFGPAEELVPAGAESHFYPTWSPDGHWIAFATAPASATQVSYSNPQARLSLVNRDTKMVHELGNATYKAGRTVAYPKFAPFTQSGGLMFLSFNSKNDYGFYVRANNGYMAPQVWLTSIDPSKLLVGEDPSTVPIWLPFQDFKERNYLGFWSERIGCRLDGAGTSVGCGVNEVCSNGACAMVSR